MGGVWEVRQGVGHFGEGGLPSRGATWHMESETPPKLLHLPYVKEVSERIEKMCRPLGVKTVMKTADTVT